MDKKKGGGTIREEMQVVAEISFPVVLGSFAHAAITNTYTPHDIKH